MKNALMNENGDVMEKSTSKSKTRTILFMSILVLVIFFMNSGIFEIGGNSGEVEDTRVYAALEQSLMKIEGVGEVTLYFHSNENNEELVNPLSNYFSTSTSQTKKNSKPIEGILVVAEGAKDPAIKNELARILSAVLQLPEHRIVIVEMKKRGNTDENK